MPTRNFVAIFLAVIISFACYQTAERNRYASTIGSAMSIVEDRALDPRPRRELFTAAMNGMMKSLDEHSMFIDEKRLPILEEQLDQEFGGVGFVVEPDPDTKEVRVLSPMVGTPAYEAGIKAGDIILGIDGEPVTPENASETVDRIRGKPGTQVTLNLKAEATGETRDVTLTRQIIEVESVIGDRRNPDGSWEFTLEERPELGYIRITDFGEKTPQELTEALSPIANDIEGLIIDLRDNTGGLLDRAVEVCDLFLNEGVIVTIKTRGGELDRAPYTATQGTIIPESIPMSILINGDTASASEIVSGCLQDHKRAIIVGSRSYGKGTVQQIIKIDGGRSALKLTVASYWRPSGRNIHRLRDQTDGEWGVSPDEGYEELLEGSRQRDWLIWRRRRDYPATRMTAEMIEALLPPLDTVNGAAGSEIEDGTTPEVDPDAPPDPQLERAIEAIQNQQQAAVVQN